MSKSRIQQNRPSKRRSTGDDTMPATPPQRPALETRRTVRKRSKVTVCGLPLWEIARGPNPELGERRGHARAVFAVGDVADGVIAVGGISRGIISIGGLAVGVLALGGVSVGILAALGGVAVGTIAMGGLAIGAVARRGAHSRRFARAEGLKSMCRPGDRKFRAPPQGATLIEPR